MKDKLKIYQIILSVLYIALNAKAILAAFRSNIWSKEIDLINHVTNYTAHLQVIAIILSITIIALLFAHFKKIKVALVPSILILGTTILLFANTQIYFKKWLEINIIATGALLLFTLILVLQVAIKLVRKNQG